MASIQQVGESAERQAAVLPVGGVSTLLGIPAVTLRTWEGRYGVGPSARTGGGHRRYTAEDVERLRRMQQLIGSGVMPQDAARLSRQVRTSTGATPVDVEDLARTVITLGESLRITELGDLVDACLDQRGAGPTWNEILAPAFRLLEDRFVARRDCTDVELLVAAEFEAALSRYVERRRLRSDGADPILLVLCPDEGHTLPMTVLRTVLLEYHHPAVLLGPGTTTDAVLEFVNRTTPVAVVLWARTRRTGHAELYRAVRDSCRRTFTAGPAWPRRTKPLTTLSAALSTLSQPA